MRFLMPSALALLLLAPSHAVAQEREWSIDQTDSEAYLVFGVPESDDVGVSFFCKLQSNVVQFLVPETGASVKVKKHVPFTLEVPPRNFTIKGNTTANEEGTSPSLEAELKITHPVFSALSQANFFAVKVGKSREVYPLQEANFTTFLDACKKP